MELFLGLHGPEGGGRGRILCFPYYYVCSDLWSRLLHMSCSVPVTFSTWQSRKIFYESQVDRESNILQNDNHSQLQ